MRDFDGVRAEAFLAAHEIADEQVSVFELLKAGDLGDIQIGRNLVAKLPHDLLVRCDLDQTFLRAAADERVAIGEPLRFASSPSWAASMLPFASLWTLRT